MTPFAETVELLEEVRVLKARAAQTLLKSSASTAAVGTRDPVSPPSDSGLACTQVSGVQERLKA